MVGAAGPRGRWQQLASYGEPSDILRLAEALAANGAGGFLVEMGSEREAEAFAHVPAEVRVLGVLRGPGRDGPGGEA